MRRTLAGARPGTALTRTAAGLLAALLLTAPLLTLWAPPAAAHTRLESTAPADGSTAQAPVTEVTLRFTLPVSLLGDGVVIEGPDGAVPADVAAAQGGVVLVATPAAALPAGRYTVTWTAAAQDGHPLEGTFGFAVAAAEPTVTPSAAPSATPSPTSSGHDMSGMSGMDHDMGHDAADMDSPATDAAGAIARLGGAGALWGALVAGGGLAFVALVLRGRDESDVPAVLRLVRWSGAVLLAGLAVRVLAGSVLVAHGDLTAAVSPAAIADSLTGTTRWDVGLQAAGGVAITAGAGQVLAGHSNTVEPRGLVVTADVAHLAAAAVWVGGVVTLALLLRARRRHGRDLDAAPLGARFSVVAAVAAAVVGVAGVALAVSILDHPAQLWESEWGLLLLAKVALVVLVAAVGAHNHFQVVPRLTARRRGVVRHAGRSATAGGVLRRSTGRETALMVAIVLLTAWLVTASVGH